VDTVVVHRANLVDNRVVRKPRQAVSSVLPEEADRTAGPEITSRTFDPPPVASGASLPGSGGCLTTVRSRVRARRDAIGIPVSILPSGRRSPRASAVHPLDAFLEARMSDLPLPADVGRPLDPTRPIPPSAQPSHIAALEAAVRERTSLVPRVGIVLGSGLGDLAADLEDVVAIPFAELPGWPAATAPGHAGRLLLGRLGGTPVVMLQGRFHLYEGYSPGLVIEPVLLFHRLGASIVVLTNAAGGLDPTFGPGTLMVMTDHINLTGLNPLIGRNADDLGERFPDLTDAWSPRLRERLHAAAKREKVKLADGVYIGLTGPNYETPAEVRMLAGLGGHAVGMSTVLECIAARWVGLEVCGVSLVTNAGAGYTGTPLSHEEVLAGGAIAGPRLARVLRRFLADLPGEDA
jgi:purine-nucleoside phosphorylase